MQYKASFPITQDQSPISYVVSETAMETKEQQALWHYNKSRDHDGLPPLDELPEGVTFAAKVRFTDIVWDTDGEPTDLPTTVELDVELAAEQSLDVDGADILSDKYGFCVESFNFEQVE